SRHIGSSRASIIGDHKAGATGLYRYGKFLIGAYPQLLFGAFYTVGKIAGGCKRQGNGVSGSRVVGGELDFQHIAQLQLNGLGGRSVSRVLCLSSSGDGEERSGGKDEFFHKKSVFVLFVFCLFDDAKMSRDLEPENKNRGL